MRVAILETVKAHAGFELEFDRIIIEALQEEGHEPVLFVPEHTTLEQDFGIPVQPLSGGAAVSYDGVRGIRKLWRSLQREHRRRKWFDSAVRQAGEGHIDAILITTATYRYLRAVRKSKMRQSPVPIYLIFLGVNPAEKPKFLRGANACLDCKNVHLRVTTLRDDFGDALPANARLIPPPVMVPHGLAEQAHTGLCIGFFGHYRKGEKKLDWLLHAVRDCHFPQDVTFRIQLVPTTEADRESVSELVRQYADLPQVTFSTEALLGMDWYQAIQNVDAVFLPYTAERYRYNWSAIYFTAIGCHKPILTSSVLNPEVMKQFHIGEILDFDDEAAFSRGLLDAICHFHERRKEYEKELVRANKAFSKQRFLRAVFQESQSENL